MIDFDYKILSTKRTTIMGTAMLLVVFFHSSIDLSRIPILQLIKQTGDIGVDIFLIASGIGIYFSLLKHQSFVEYISSRIQRILPAYFIINSIWFAAWDFILGDPDFLAFLLDISSLSFWLKGRLTTWYLSSLFLLQLLTPCYVKVLNRFPRIFIYSTILLYFSGGIILHFPEIESIFGHLLIFIFRIPAYLLGLSIGQAIHRGQSMSVHRYSIWSICLLSVGIISLAYGIFPVRIRWALKYIAYLPLALLLAFAFSKIGDKKICTFLGTRSLEIYLLHEKVLWLFSAILRKFFNGFGENGIMVNLFAILVTFLSAEITHTLLTVLLHRKDRRKNV